MCLLVGVSREAVAFLLTHHPGVARSLGVRTWPYLFPKMLRSPCSPEEHPRQPQFWSSTTASPGSAFLGTRQMATVPNLKFLVLIAYVQHSFSYPGCGSLVTGGGS